MYRFYYRNCMLGGRKMALYKVEICGVNTSKLPLLNNSEKEELFQRILKGDKEARELYIKGNLRLVLSIIQRFSNSNENVDDLFQIGCIGLMKAIDNFDITQNVKFSTYAVPMIIGEIRRYLRDNNTIRVSRSLRDTAYKAIYAKEELMKLYPLRKKTLTKPKPIAKLYSLEPKDCYTIGEITEKFLVNESTVYLHIRKYSIPTRQIGNFVYVPKKEIDNLYKGVKR